MLRLFVSLYHKWTMGILEAMSLGLIHMVSPILYGHACIFMYRIFMAQAWGFLTRSKKEKKKKKATHTWSKQTVPPRKNKNTAITSPRHIMYAYKPDFCGLSQKDICLTWDDGSWRAARPSGLKAEGGGRGGEGGSHAEAGAGAGWGAGVYVIDSERPEEPCSHSHYVPRTWLHLMHYRVRCGGQRGRCEETQRGGRGRGGKRRYTKEAWGGHEGMERVWQRGKGWKIGEKIRGDEDISRITITDSYKI